MAAETDSEADLARDTTTRVRCNIRGCRRSVKRWFIVDECPEADGWTREVLEIGSVVYTCPLHNLAKEEPNDPSLQDTNWRGAGRKKG